MAATPEAARTLGAPSVEARAMRGGGIALLFNGVLTALLGLAYWIVASRLFGTANLGRNSSLISAMLTVSGLAQLNYTRTLASLIPNAGARAVRLVGRVYLTVAALSLGAGAAIAAVLPDLGARFGYLRPPSLAVPGFALAVSLWSIFTLEDTVLAATRKATLVPFENTFFGIAKLALLFLFAAVKLGPLSIFAAWTLPLILIVVPLNLYAFRRALPLVQRMSEERRYEATASAGRWDFAGYMFWLLGTSPLPFLVLAVLGAQKAASFYIPLTVTTAIDVVTLNVGNSITAEITRSRGSIDRHAARLIAGYWALVLGGSLVGAGVAPLVLRIFGHEYSTHGGTVLRLLLLASGARAAMFLGNAIGRARQRGRRILVVQALASTLTLAVGFLTMPSLGTKGMALGWLIGSVVAGAVALRWLLPALSRGLRSSTA
ncbi:MAG: lipopolysaccharide biosynthesis protein [Acidimicrobiales bacterium]